MIAGVIKNIALPPIGNRDIDEKENFIPFNVELRNGRLSKTGKWRQRHGYGDAVSIGYKSQIVSLIPEDRGIAITEDGRLYRNILNTSSQMTGRSLDGINRPHWAKFDKDIVVVDGGNPVNITGKNTEILAGSPPFARFIGRVGAYTLMSGYSDTEFTWSAANNHENYTTGDSGTTNVKKTGKILFSTDYKDKWYVWKDNEIEVWYNRGGSTPFVRLNELTVPVGCGASNSIIKANETIYWIDDKLKFRTLNGAQIISSLYESYIFKYLKHPESVYGLPFEREHCVRWFSQQDRLCFKYDYEANLFSEDNYLIDGNFDYMPISSVMDLDGNTYIGDLNYTGNVYTWSSDYKSDNGNPIAVMRRFRIRLTESDNRASVNQLRFMMKRGEGLNGSNARAWIRYRFDNNVNSEIKLINLGTINDKNSDVTFSGLGKGRELEMEIWMTDTSDYLLTGAKIITKELGR